MDRPYITVTLILAVLMTAALRLPTSAQTVAYTGATLWDGTGSPPIADATLVVEGGRIVSVGADAQPPAGSEIVFLEGKYVIPGLINSHGHVSGAWADEEIASFAVRIEEDLRLYARYGVTTVNSLGDGPMVLATSRDPSAGQPRARLLAAGPVITDTDPAEARATALALADAGADWLKVRVDDNLGTSAKMPWDAVQAVMDVAVERGLRVATHLFYLEDAKRLLEMGTELVAHSVRDVDVDDAFVAALGASGVCYVPTLVREVSTFVYGTRPTFFDDPFFQRYAKESEVERLSAPAQMEEVSGSPAAARYRVALLQAMRNLTAVHGAGVPIAFGTDSGPAARFPGYFEHMELSLMVGAGLTPEQALRSATGVAATCLGLDDRGTLEAGKWADFLVLAQNPLRNIEATRSLERVFVGGVEVPQGEAVAAEGGPR